MRRRRPRSKLGALLPAASLIIIFVLLSLPASAQRYKEMMRNMRVNVYDVVDEAERYFETRDKNAKGSGWKAYQRWLYENEIKYYPSGDRTGVDPFFAAKASKAFRLNNPSSNALYPGGWEDLGPYYIDQVTGHYSAGLGRVETFYVDPNNDQRIYLGSRSGGFWKTLDGGNTWTGSSTDFLFATGVNTMTVSPTNPNEVLINLRNAMDGTTHGVYRSTNGGDTWAETNFNPTNLGWGGLGTNDWVYKIAYHPTVSNLIFIATSNGLYRSSNNLSSWTRPIAGLYFTDIAFHPTNPNIIYASAWNTPEVIYISFDGGVNFFTSATISGNASLIHLSTSPACPDCVFVGSSDGVWRSVNQGLNYTLIATQANGLPENGNYGGFAVSDVNANYILYGDIDVHMSSNGGATFNQATIWYLGDANYDTYGNYVHADIRKAESHNGVFWIMTDGFLCKSLDNGVSWQIYEGQGIRENYSLGASQSNHYRTICGSQDNGTSIKTENGWIEFYGADGMEGIIHPLNDDWMMGSVQYGVRLRTKDGGQNVSTITPPGQEGSWIAPMFYDPNDQMTVYSLGANIFKSEDFGTNWTNIGTPNFSGAITDGAIAENNSNIIVATNYDAIEKSVDGGVTFTSIKGTLPNYYITDVVFDPKDDNVIVVTYGQPFNDNSKVFLSTDQGASWQNITYNLNDMPVRSAAIDHTDASTIYLGTEIGVYKKAMNENAWSLYSPDLPNMSVHELEIVWGSNTLRAATWGRGLWEYALDGRNDYPAILSTEITQQPTEETPNADVDQFVTSTIDYDNAISSAYLEWSVNSPTFGNAINMSNTGANVWVSDSPLPKYPSGSKMYFKVFAVGNNADTSETYKFMYTLQAPLLECRMLDSLTLVSLYNATGGPGWTNTWDLNQPMDSWYGVQLNVDGCVSCLDLDGVPDCAFNYDEGNNLSGVLPATLGDLANLQVLSLSQNQLSGSIPPELGNLSNLTILSLRGNQLSGNIPSQLGALFNLTYLSLNVNQLSGSVPAELGDLSSLEYLYLYTNQLSGSIPPELGALSNLRILSVFGNQLSGNIPLELSGLSSLTGLFLYNNQLSGAIPPELSLLSNLTHLYLFNNQLSGTIPTQLSALSNLLWLYLYGNQLSGIIPTQLSALPNLRGLDLSFNQLTGSIPSSLGNLPSLTQLYLESNQLSGEIPLELSNLTGLTILYLANNQLSGEIPPELDALTNLTQLYLHDNQLSGCFPAGMQIFCALGVSPGSYQDGYNFTNNPELPWLGDFERFCNNEEQIGANCDDGDPGTSNEVIAANCECSDQCSVSWFADADGDSFGDPNNSVQACDQPPGYVADNTDCNDSNANINPGAQEICDGVDNDCDGLVDDADSSVSGQTVWYADNDGDGLGDPNNSLQACVQPPGYVANNTDCNDNLVGPCSGLDVTYFLANEKIDNDGADDFYEIDVMAESTNGFALGSGLLYLNYNLAAFGSNIHTAGALTVSLPETSILTATALEVFDFYTGFITNDNTLSRFSFTWQQGGFSAGCLTGNNINATPVLLFRIRIKYAPGGLAFDPELCFESGDLFDDQTFTACGPSGSCTTGDCNSEPPEQIVNDYFDCIIRSPWYADNDGDGFGNPADSVLAANQPPGFVVDNTDCDDTNTDVNPGAQEICDDGIDNNCDGFLLTSPIVNDPIITQPTIDTPTGTIVVQASGTGTLEYSIDGGLNWDFSNTFSGLDPGNYDIQVRLQSDPDCITAYAGNPVIIYDVPGILVRPVVYLQGAYDLLTGLMSDGLRAGLVLPLSEPYTALGYTHIGGGGENTTQTILDLSGSDAVVDWVFLELRDKSNFSIIQTTRSALLQRDGDVVDMDGVSPVNFANISADDYYLVVKHRNHLGVMSAAPVALSGTPAIVDFTNNLSLTFGENNGIAALGDGNLGLYSGDFNQNGQVQNTDFTFLIPTLGTAGYLPGDLDLNGQVQNTDLQLKLLPNIGKGQPFGQ